jgi:hypothetical protein
MTRHSCTHARDTTYFEIEIEIYYSCRDRDDERLLLNIHCEHCHELYSILALEYWSSSTVEKDTSTQYYYYTTVVVVPGQASAHLHQTV